MVTCKSQKITAGYWIKKTTEGKLSRRNTTLWRRTKRKSGKVRKARKVPVTKLKLETFHKLVKNLESTFWSLSVTCTRIDKLFDSHKETNIKSPKRDWRSDGKGVLTKVSTLNQPHPVEMNNFWALSDNKVLFQQIFTKMDESATDQTYLCIPWWISQWR